MTQHILRTYAGEPIEIGNHVEIGVGGAAPWVSTDTHGTVVKVGRERVHIQLDHETCRKTPRSYDPGAILRIA
jgi:hypothetical protein